MDNLLSRFNTLINGVLHGFDRIVFKGLILPLMSSTEAMSFFRAKKILFKEYKQWMMDQTRNIISPADHYLKEIFGNDDRIIPINSSHIRKEELAHTRQNEKKIEKGLIGIWSCVESCSSYRATYSKEHTYPQLQNYPTRCKHLYFYFDDENLGFMNIRLQTWFPYHIQICLNGREWLRRSLEKENIDFTVKGNKFLSISDYEKAQQLLDKQLDTSFVDLLSSFLPTVFPMMKDILGPYLSYYWTLWQSEWASDIIFKSINTLETITSSLLRHAHMIGCSSRVLRYLDRPLTKADKPYKSLKDDVITRVNDFTDGLRIRHWVGNNSVKYYNEKNVLRIETTINEPGKFKVFRTKQGQSSDSDKTLLPLRKGIMDIPLRAQISQFVNNRLSDDLALLHSTIPVKDIIQEINKSITRKGKKYRALEIMGKDLEIFQAISDPVYNISNISNKELRKKLANKKFGKGKNEKQLSGKISRHFKLLRIHGIIKKIPKQHKYKVTQKGRKLLHCMNAILAASTEELVKLAA